MCAFAASSSATSLSAVTYSQELYTPVNTYGGTMVSTATGMFTAPVRGIYRFDYGAVVDNCGSSLCGSNYFYLFKVK